VGWADSRLVFLSSSGVVSRYPKNWKKLVWDAFIAGAAAGEIE
jgi:hypothetical protein